MKNTFAKLTAASGMLLVSSVTAFVVTFGDLTRQARESSLSEVGLAIFVGYYVVWSVTPALHTPLMSVTNAISSVIVVGALLAVAVEHGGIEAFTTLDSNLTSKIFGLIALVMASVNIFGGCLVTQRMLGMYKKKGDKR